MLQPRCIARVSILLCCLLQAADALAATIVVAVQTADGRPLAGAVITIHSLTGSDHPGVPVNAVMDQVNRAFVPDLVAITVGESVSFPNRDPFLHNVFSQSAARKFDLGSFKKDEQKSKDFPDPGVIDVYCNIHPEMAATILVLPNRAHTRRNSDGSYVIAAVPPGTWTVFAYTRRVTKPVSATVTVVAGQDAKVDLALVRGAEEQHLNKYGEKYHDTGTTTYH